MIQTRPTSATGRMPSGQQQPVSQYGAQSPRTAFNGNATFTGYRGSSTPVQQYAFQSTPSLNQPYRSNTADHEPNFNRHRFPSQAPSGGAVMGVGQGGSRDDTAILQARHAVPVTRPPPTVVPVSKNAPDRYRRSGQQAQHSRSHSAGPSLINLPNTAQFYNVANNARSNMAARPTSFYATIPGQSMDDMHIPQQTQHDKGMRRRSVQAFDSTSKQQSDTLRPAAYTAHSRSGSSESVNSSRSNHSRPSVSFS